MDYYFDVLRKYAVFSGRASRKEYWMFFLFNVIISIGLGIASNMAFDNPANVLGSFYNLAVLVPSLAVLSRRLHDTNRSAWWMLIGIIPLVGWVWLLVLTISKGTVGDNGYGPDPKTASA